MDHLCYLCLVFVMLLRLFTVALWSPAGKGLTSWLLFVMLNCVFVTFPCGILGHVKYLIVSIPIFAAFLTFIVATYDISSPKSNVYLLYLLFLFSVHEIFHGRMTHGRLERIIYFVEVDFNQFILI